MSKVWVAFGMGHHFSVLNINGVRSSLGESKSQALPVFHVFTGCYCTSQFCGIGKKDSVAYGCRKVAKFDNKYFHSIKDIFSFAVNIFIR